MGIKKDFKSMVQGYFDMCNGKVSATDKLEKSLIEWNISREELRKLIVPAILQGKKRPQIVEIVMDYGFVKTYDNSTKEEQVKLAIIGLLYVLCEAIDYYEKNNNKTITKEDLEL